MNTRWVCLLSLGAAGGLAVLAAVAAEVEITGNRVNLRARPSMTAEVAAQCATGEKLQLRSATNDWVEVVPPARVDAWVHRDFIKDGRVAVPTLNVRAGAGINYSKIGTLKRGDAVTLRGEFGEWLKIAPPPDSSLWVSRQFVRLPEAPAPKPPEAAAQPPPAKPGALPPPPAAHEAPAVRVVPPPAPRAVAAVAEREAAKPYVPTDVRLAPVDNQGRVVIREGRVRTVVFMFRQPSRFHLVTTKGYHSETLCFLRGNDAQLKTMEGRRLRIKGREYIVQGSRYPMVVVDQIMLLDEGR